VENPRAGLIFGPEGNLYGTASGGRQTPAWCSRSNHSNGARGDFLETVEPPLWEKTRQEHHLAVLERIREGRKAHVFGHLQGEHPGAIADAFFNSTNLELNLNQSAQADPLTALQLSH